VIKTAGKNNGGQAVKTLFRETVKKSRPKVGLSSAVFKNSRCLVERNFQQDSGTVGNKKKAGHKKNCTGHMTQVEKVSATIP
jgi:hypothetical protein